MKRAVIASNIVRRKMSVPLSSGLAWKIRLTDGPFIFHNASKYLPLHCSCSNQVQYQYRSFSTGKRSYVRSEPASVTLFQSINESPGAQPVNANIGEYIESVQQTGNVAVLFSDAPPVLWTVEALCTIKDLPGMTWISTIICGTLFLRMIIGVPTAIAQGRAMTRLENLTPQIKKLGDELKYETAIAIKKFNWDEKTARRQFEKSYKKHWRNLVESNNCHPMKNLALSVIQLPFWICFSSALRNVVYAVPLPRTTDKIERWVQIHNESTPWVESLVVPDPVVFPVVFLVMNFLNIEFNRKQKLQAVPETKLQKIFPWVLRGGIVAIACIATSVPSAVSMYWATSSSLALAQNLVLASPTAKRIFKTSVNRPLLSQSNGTKLS